jgi:hypothetical protein
MKLYGDQLGPQHIVFINGKPIMSNIKELDTEEGWVDIFLPILPDKVVTAEFEEEVSKTEAEIISEAQNLEYEVKRLEGEVKVGELKADEQDSCN